MGACTFTQLSELADSEQAFRTVCQEAAHEFGAGGYSGSIAEKNSFSVLNHQPLPLHQAEELAGEIMGNPDHPDHYKVADKWGPAGALLVDLDQPEIRTIQVELSTNQSGSLNVQDLAREHCHIDEDEYLLSARVVSDEAELKPQVRENYGQDQTIYVIVQPDSLQPARGFQDSYPTLEDAKHALGAKLREETSPWEHPGNRAYEIVGVVRREGQALACGSQEVTSRQVVMEAQIAKIPERSSEKLGWLFFGWASC